RSSRNRMVKSRGAALERDRGGYRADDNDGLCERKIIGDRKVDLRAVPLWRDLLETFQRSVGERDRGLATAQIDDAHIAPEDAPSEARAQRLGTGFLGGE